MFLEMEDVEDVEGFICHHFSKSQHHQVTAWKTAVEPPHHAPCTAPVLLRRPGSAARSGLDQSEEVVPATHEVPRGEDPVGPGSTGSA